MSDKEKALAVLQLASQTCSAAIKALADSTTSAQPSGVGTDASIDTRLKDFASLLSLLYQNVTKLAIALKPSSPTYRAVITPARELTAQTDALVSCACSIDGASNGAALVREVRWAAEGVVNALGTLLGVYAADAQAPGARLTRTAGEEYLVRTGAVHEAIDRARYLSSSNREAVKKRWDGVIGGVDDCVKEVQEMLEEEDDENGDEGEDEGEGSDPLGGDDDWGELDAAPASHKESVKANEEELARLKSAQHLMKFTHALLKRMSLIVLEPSSVFASLPPSTFDDLLLRSDALLSAADDLVNALYVPQEPETVSQRLSSFMIPVNNLQGIASSLGLVATPVVPREDRDDIADLGQRVASLGLSAQPVVVEPVIAKERKWFDVCFAQITKSASSVASGA
ncbi:hypothetical protein M0805_006857 [Coniferiporia weirii]|nr:hypothetical protein M0805_006857 [Coniferiporia weirii]